MKIGMLVGACGLALAANAVAQGPGAPGTNGMASGGDTDFVTARDRAVGLMGSAQRAETVNELKAAIRRGELDPRRVLLADVLDESMVINEGRKPLVDVDAHRNGGDAFLFGGGEIGDIPGCDYGDAMNIYAQTDLTSSASYVPLAGQNNHLGLPWLAAAAWIGVVDDTTVDNGPDWGNPALGLVIPGGDGQYGTVPRGSTNQANSPGGFFRARTETRNPTLGGILYAPTATDTMVTMADLYMQNIDCFHWYRPISSTEGFIISNIFLGGYDFATFAAFTNPMNIIDKPIMLGTLDGNYVIGQFYGADRLINTNEWMTIATRQTPNSFGWWIKDSVSTGTATAPNFAGEIFANDWVCLYPGGVTGTGQIPFALTEFGSTPPNFLEGGVRRVALPLAAVSFDEYQMIDGFDPTAAQVPGFRPKDWHFDNICIQSPIFPQPDPPPCSVPYLDDVELWSLGSLVLQGDRWFDALSSRAEVTDLLANSGTQSIVQENFTIDAVFREEFSTDVPPGCGGPRLTACPGMPLWFRSSIFLTNNTCSRAVRNVDLDTQDGLASGWVIFGGVDANGNVVNRVYIRQRNPDYDNTMPDSPDANAGRQNVVYTGQNLEFINVPAVFASNGSPVTVPFLDWVDVMACIDVKPLPSFPFFEFNLIVTLDGAEIIPDPSFATATSGSTYDKWRIETNTGDEIQYWSGNNPVGPNELIFVDDVIVDGTPRPVPTPNTIGGDPYTSQSPWTLDPDFWDDFEGYKAGETIGGQGYADGFMSVGGPVGNWPAFNALDPNIMIAAGPMPNPGDPVYLYQVNASTNNFITTGTTLAVTNNLISTYDPANVSVPGLTSADVGFTFVDKLNRLVINDEGEFLLLDELPQPFDPGLHVGGYKFEWNYIARYGAAGFGSAVVSDVTGTALDDTGSVGNVICMPNNGANVLAEDEIPPQFLIFTSLFPEAVAAGPTDQVCLDAQFYIESDTTFPRTGFTMSVFGGTVDGGYITDVAFGGTTLVTDNNSVPNQTFGDAGNIHVLVPNPNPGGTNPENVWDDTLTSVPLNQWFTTRVKVNNDGSYEVYLNTGSVGGDIKNEDGYVLIASGAAIDAGSGLVINSIDGLFISCFYDEGGDGEPVLGPVTMSTLGPAAPAPLGTGNQPTYAFYEIGVIDPGSDLSALQVTEVDPITGAVGVVRDLGAGDVVVLANRAGIGMPLLHNPLPTNGEWDSGGVASGNWTLLGQPGQAGLNDPIPNGGVANAGGPPYNSGAPFRTMVMGNFDNVPAFPDPVPPTVMYLRKAHVAAIAGTPPCPTDLVMNGQTDGADLAFLLGAWGPNPGNPADFTGNGIVDGADLAILLGAWGPCPM